MGKSLNKDMMSKFIYLSNVIVNEKIKMRISDDDLEMLKYVVAKETPVDDKKIILVEDQSILGCFRRAVKILNKCIVENERNSKKTRSH